MVLMRFGSLMLMVLGPTRTAEPYRRCHSTFVRSICPEVVAIARQMFVNLAARGPGNARKGEKTNSQKTKVATQQPTAKKSELVERTSMISARGQTSCDTFDSGNEIKGGAGMRTRRYRGNGKAPCGVRTTPSFSCMGNWEFGTSAEGE
jgi:hypothetical protein